MRLGDVKSAARYFWRRWAGGPAQRRVLDVGSGHRPHEDATHLVDLLPGDDSERGGAVKMLGRSLVVATVEALPFKDGTFDYVYACHVLEHTDRPAEACRELMRVARAGYIETPSPFFEQGYNYPKPDRGWSFHKWFVWADRRDTLVFEPKTPVSIDQFCDCRHAHFVRGVYERVDDLNRVGRVLPHECRNTVLHWTDRFAYEVRDKGGEG
jgi:SAM-dependent methyltransferase